MKTTIAHIEAGNKIYPIVFNLNVLEEIQEKYGSLEKWGEITQGDGVPSIKNLKVGMMIMMNEAIDIENEKNGTNEPPVTEKQVGRIMSDVGLEEILKKIQGITVASTKIEGEEGKNE